jgi:hypothetical protein
MELLLFFIICIWLMAADLREFRKRYPSREKPGDEV